MTVALSNADFRELVDIVKRLPNFDTRSQRMASWVRPAFLGRPRGDVVIDNIPAAGDHNETVASSIVAYLATQFGQTEPGIESLGVFLEQVATGVGQEQADRLTELIARYGMLDGPQEPNGGPPVDGGHFLDSPALDWTRPEPRELHELLATMYWREAEVIAVVQEAGIPPGEIHWGTSMAEAWREIMEKGQARVRLRPLLDLVLADPAKAAYHSRLDELLADAPVLAAPVAREVDWQAEEPEEEGGLERILGDHSTLLDIAFLSEGLRISKAIARITATFSAGRFYGTGFLIGEDLLLTNHHVLFNHDAADEPAQAVEVWFDYQRTFAGAETPHRSFAGRAETIVGDKPHDWSIVRLTEPPSEDYPRLKLGGGELQVNDRVYIIQHPEGAPKQIGMHNNLVRHVDDEVVQYLTDTMHGSSGSPVFNEHWEVVALHHRWTRAGGGLRREYRNQGINIARVLEDLRAAGIEL